MHSPEEIAGARLREHQLTLPPSNEIPGIVAINRIVGDSTDAVIVLTHVSVYSRGWLWHLEARAHPDMDDAHHLDSFMPFSAPDGRVNFALRWASGGVDTESLPGQGLRHRGGTSSSGAASTSFWLMPRPAHLESLAAQVSWPAFSIHGNYAQLPDEILQALQHASVVTLQHLED